MNIATPVRDLDAARALEGKVSLVTGSTSGIGLGIARALAAQGSAVVLNGFGDRQEIDRDHRAADRGLRACTPSIRRPT